MELRRYLNLVRQRLALVIIALIVGGTVGYLTTSRTPVYTATTTIYVGSLNLSADQAELYLKSGGGPARQLTDLNRDLLAGKTVEPVEAFRFISNDNKWTVEA